MHACMCLHYIRTYDIWYITKFWVGKLWRIPFTKILPRNFNSVVNRKLCCHSTLMYIAALHALHKTEEEFGSEDKDKLVKVFHYV